MKYTTGTDVSTRGPRQCEGQIEADVCAIRGRWCPRKPRGAASCPPRARRQLGAPSCAWWAPAPGTDTALLRATVTPPQSAPRSLGPQGSGGCGARRPAARPVTRRPHASSRSSEASHGDRRLRPPWEVHGQLLGAGRRGPARTARPGPQRRGPAPVIKALCYLPAAQRRKVSCVTAAASFQT